MKHLASAAAIATIIAAVFSVASYVDKDSTIIVFPPSKQETAYEQLEPKAPPREIELPTTAREKLDQEPIISNKQLMIRYDAALKIPGSSTKTSTLRDLAYRAIDSKNYKDAFTISKSIPGFTTKSSVLSNLATEIAKSGDIEFATIVAESIPGSSTKSSTLSKIANL